MEIPAAARRNYQARVELDRVYRADGLLSYITLRPVRRAGDRFQTPAVLRSFAKRLRSEIYANVRQQVPGWTDYRIRTTLRVSIFMYNRDDEGGVAANQQDTLIGNVEENTFMYLFELASGQGSNRNLGIYDVIWKVWINPASVVEGATQIETTPEQDADTEKMNTAGVVKYMKLKHDDGSIGCAAHALAIGLDLKERPGRKNRHLDIKFTQFCKTLQESMGFNDPKFATIFELKKFVSVYKHYRLVILQTAIHTPTIYIGMIKLTRCRI